MWSKQIEVGRSIFYVPKLIEDSSFLAKREILSVESENHFLHLRREARLIEEETKILPSLVSLIQFYNSSFSGTLLFSVTKKNGDRHWDMLTHHQMIRPPHLLKKIKRVNNIVVEVAWQRYNVEYAIKMTYSTITLVLMNENENQKEIEYKHDLLFPKSKFPSEILEMIDIFEFDSENFFLCHHELKMFYWITQTKINDKWSLQLQRLDNDIWIGNQIRRVWVLETNFQKLLLVRKQRGKINYYC